MKKQILSVFIFLIFSILQNKCIAQKQNNIWYFGNGAGLDFNTGIPIAVSNGNLYTEEGCASVCDENGKLLFYTNGVKVWNKEHNVMPNGDMLYGHISSTQSALIVKKLNSSSQFYVFTVTEKGGQQGVCYSIVDMTKDRTTTESRIKTNSLKTPDIDISFGRGDVILKNQPLLNYTSEKLIAIPHKNGQAVWILTHKWNSNEFHAFPLTDNGIGKPVISPIGAFHRDFGSKNNGESIGYLAISPDGKRLASAMCYSSNASIELFDFDDATGVISNLVEVQTGGFAYSVCFSPDNTKLYTSFLKGAVGLKQYDVTIEDPFDSEEIIARSSPENFFGAIQRGPDNKIYIAKVGNAIDVISYPNKKGIECGYSLNEIKLNDRYSVYGLPNLTVIPNSIPKPTETSYKNITKTELKKLNINLGSDTTLCGGTVSLDAGVKNASYLWSTGEKTKIIEAKISGNYWVKVEQHGQFGADTINVTITTNTTNPILLKKEYRIVCEDKILLDCGVTGAKYHWSTDETIQKIEVNESNYYSVTVSLDGCEFKQRTYVNFISQPTKVKYLPEFAPKSPLFNNYFAITLNDIESFDLKIYTKKGKLIFTSNSQTKKWEGKDEKGNFLPEGEYQWELTFKPICDNKSKTEKGKVFLKS